MYPVLRLALGGLLAVVLQWLVFGRLKLWGAYPDVVLLWVALQALRYGRTTGAVAGFTTGLLLDAVYGTWGLEMVLKTTLGFVVGLFRSELGENLRIRPEQAFLGALLVGVVHHGLRVIILALDQDTRTTFLITGLWFGSALYTACVAYVLSLYRTR
jgi:rod shape-determining protein MreD